MVSHDAIRKTCWHECDGDPGLYPMNLAEVPIYSHEDSREQFVGVATFYGCVELCEDEQMQIQHMNRLEKAAIFVLPIIAAGNLLLCLNDSYYFISILTNITCPLWSISFENN